MDYSYFAAPDQPYTFMGLPPTPAHAYEPGDEQQNDVADAYHAVNGFHTYDQSFQYNTSQFLQPQQPHHQLSPPIHQQSPPIHQQSPPLLSHRSSISGLPHVDTSSGVINIGDYDHNDQSGNRSSSEEKESLTPAMSRRKAQNRAAQRAFRERKERHVKDLENKLNSLSAHSSTLLTDNERLKRELQKLATQNEILRATSNNGPLASGQTFRPPSPVPGPQSYSPTDFRAVSVDPTQRPGSYQESRSEDGERLLAAGATWDLIQGHELCRKGMVDVGDVCRRLRGKAACDGKGPAFVESEVIAAIEESVISAADELI